MTPFKGTTHRGSVCLRDARLLFSGGEGAAEGPATTWFGKSLSQLFPNPSHVRSPPRPLPRPRPRPRPPPSFMVHAFQRCFRRKHHAALRAHMHSAGGPADPDALNDLFMSHLANQAGVIMAADAGQKKK